MTLMNSRDDQYPEINKLQKIKKRIDKVLVDEQNEINKNKKDKKERRYQTKMYSKNFFSSAATFYTYRR